MTQESPIIRPDTITVSAEVQEEIEATHADIYVTVRGASLFRGDTALKKAREVASLVAALAEVGIAESAVELRGIKADVTTGTLGNKTSSATYALRVTKVPLASVPDVIGVVTDQKNADLNSTVWIYGDDEAIRLRLFETALKKLQTKAALAARTLGVTLTAVHTLVEVFTDGEATHPEIEKMYGSAPGFERARPRRVDSEELGLRVAHRKTVFQGVQAVYRVSPFGAE